MENVFFDTWESVIRTICLTVLGYVAMILLLRVSGKRTLSKMNAFDFVITVTLGSSLATLSLNKNVSLTDGIVAFSLFILLQYILTWLSVRVKKVKSLITSSPTLLFYNGEFLLDVMKKQRVTVDEVFKVARQKGISNLDNVDMMILETTGEVTVIERNVQGGLNTVGNIKATE
ncbi:DUF421 domain-containing protein [Parapedobacter deserti]|uniref:DUF421 domain-containing protein n=1 Tax=Parapedobacter deserti TaxID=1912957 RepID=A0ABV7JSJ7_9SPHI